MRMAIADTTSTDVYLHSLTVLRQAIALEDGDPDLFCVWAALLHDLGKPPPAITNPTAESSFHPPRVGRAKMARSCAGLEVFETIRKTTSRKLVYLPLRFHGYGDGRWTDSAVRRYVTDAGRCWPRCTSWCVPTALPQQARAARLQANYDGLEARIGAELAAK